VFFGKNKSDKPLQGWKISDHKLVNHDTAQTYPLTELAGAYDKAAGLVTFWYCNSYLVTISCKTTLFDSLLRCGLQLSKVSIAASVTFEAKDAQGGMWFIDENKSLSCNDKQYSLAGLRFKANDVNGIRVYFYGKLITTLLTQLASDDLKTLAQAKDIYMAREYLKSDGRYSSSPLSFKPVTSSIVKPCDVHLTTEAICPFPNSQRIKVIYSHAFFKMAQPLNTIDFSTPLIKAQKVALKNLQQEAANCGATAVFAITLQYQALEEEGGKYIVNAYGTAIDVVAQGYRDEKPVKPTSIFAPNISIESLIVE